jgi:ketosteroid isomerase-like protein
MATGTSVLLVATFLFQGLAATTTTGPEWTAAERGIWALEVRYLKLFETGDLEGMAALYHPEFLGWPSHSPEPVGHVQGRASVEGLLRTLEITQLEFEPRAILIEGGIALAHYVVILTVVADGGAREQMPFRVTHTWIKVGEAWKILGGMSARFDVAE